MLLNVGVYLFNVGVWENKLGVNIESNICEWQRSRIILFYTNIS